MQAVVLPEFSQGPAAAPEKSALPAPASPKAAPAKALKLPGTPLQLPGTPLKLPGTPLKVGSAKAIRKPCSPLKPSPLKLQPGFPGTPLKLRKGSPKPRGSASRAATPTRGAAKARLSSRTPSKAGGKTEKSIQKLRAPQRAGSVPARAPRSAKKGKALADFDNYDLPEAILEAQAKGREPKKRWPKRALNFKYWPMDTGNERDECVRDVLLKRGWIDKGAPCDPDDYNDLCDALEGKIAGWEPPRRCLYVAGDDMEARKMLKHLGGGGGQHADRFCITGFPGGEPSCYKSYTCKAMRGQPFVPETFQVPAESAELLKYAKSQPGSYWVGKPKNDYGGKGLVVTLGADKLTVDGKPGVVQQYIHRPLLVGPYKFHMRVYLLVTALRPVRAYVHNDLTVMFCTLPFSLEADQLGPAQQQEPGAGAGFEPRVHLSNYDINARPTNRELFMKKKPGVGSGCMWSAPRLEEWLRKTRRPELAPDRMWRQIHALSREVALSIGSHPIVKSFKHEESMFHELYGLDVMMDETGKVWLLECNNSPGLELCGSHFSDGLPNPDAAENDPVTWNVIEDRMKLLGFDHSEEGDEMNYYRVC